MIFWLPGKLKLQVYKKDRASVAPIRMFLASTELGLDNPASSKFSNMGPMECFDKLRITPLTLWWLIVGEEEGKTAEKERPRSFRARVSHF